MAENGPKFVPKKSPVPTRGAAPSKGEPERRDAVLTPAVPTAHEAVQPGTRRRFTASEKLRLVKAAEAAVASGERGALEALLRKEGIYSSHLSSWRRQFAAGGEAGLVARAGPQAQARRQGARAPRRDEGERGAQAQAAHRERAHRPPKKSARTAGARAPRTAGGGILMALIEARPPEVPVDAACVAVGVSRASLYRARRPAVPVVPRTPAPSARRIPEAERRAILDTLHLPEFADQPPHEVYGALLSRGIHLASIRTMYRVLAEVGETAPRRNQRAPHRHAMPTVTATAPNQVWTWDITKLATEEKGVFLMAYVIIDLFSRFVVGWMVATKECKHLAAQLFAETIARHGVEPGLQVHADRGSAMKSDTLAQLLDSLGASRSFSRPRVSNDNPQAEAHFKTMKYQPDYPGRFAGPVHARGWLADFFAWHNDDHHHSGLALFTPADVFHGRVAEVARRRQGALDGAYAAHPERFPNGAPTARLPPAVVTINPIVTETIEVEGVVAVATGDAGTPFTPPKTAHVLRDLVERVPRPSTVTHAVAT